MAIVTYNVKLRATEQQLNSFKVLLAQARDAFNLCSAMTDAEKLPYSRVAIHNVCYDLLRSKFQLLSSQQVIRVQCDVCSAYKTRRANKHHGGIPQRKQLSLTLDKRLYGKLTSKSVMLTGAERGKRECYELIGYERLSHMFENYLPKDPMLFLRDGSLWLSIPFEVQEKPLRGDSCVGVDLGVRRLFVTSEGKSFVDKAYLKERRRLRYLKRCLQSKGTKSAKRRLKSLGRRERNLSKDMVERATNALLSSTDASILVLEDLTKIKSKTSRTSGCFNRTKHNNVLSQVPFYLFKERLTHKAQLVGRRVETVSPTWTSQTDSRSGKRDGERHGCRYYCSDGVVLDADWNAAVNIALRANHPLSSTSVPLSGRVQSITQSSRGSHLSGKPISL